jgi:hypothetical protein
MKTDVLWRQILFSLAPDDPAPAPAQAPPLPPPPPPPEEGKTSLPGIRIHGNYCGPLHGHARKEGETRPDPIDKVDLACQRHDDGTDRNGYFDLATDLRLIRDEIEVQFTEDLSPGQRAAAMAITGAFAALLPLSANVTLGRKTWEAGKAAGKVIKDGAAAAASTVKDAVASTVKSGWNKVRGLFS